MHIPDGYLGPQTYLPAYAVMAPLWAVALRRVERTVRTRQVPLLALGAAFSFVIMMFNVPIPGGTSGHAAGGVLLAVLLGPWAALVAVSLALAVQALLFGDGGITTLGANCLNLAVVMPFVGWWTYRLVAGGCDVASRRRAWAAAVGGYVGLNVAAVTTAILFGIQPHIARDAAGLALYCPFGLELAVPAMALQHLLFIGFIEGAVTALVVAYVQRSEPALLDHRPALSPLVRRLAWGLGLLVLLTPLGLYLPARFGGGPAWGEWPIEEIASRVGYTPERMDRFASWWRAPMPDYALPGQEHAGLPHASLAYVLSALAGVIVLGLAASGLKIWFNRRAGAERHS